MGSGGGAQAQGEAEHDERRTSRGTRGIEVPHLIVMTHAAKAPRQCRLLILEKTYAGTYPLPGSACISWWCTHIIRTTRLSYRSPG